MLERYLKVKEYPNVDIDLANLSFIAEQSDEDLTQQAEAVVQQLPLRLRVGPMRLMENIRLNRQRPQFKEMIYVPVKHLFPQLDDLSEIRTFTREISEILEGEAKGCVLIAVGEESSGKFSKNSILNERARRYKLISNDGIISSADVAKLNNAPKAFDAYYHSLFNHGRKYPSVRMIGVDSLNMQTLVYLFVNSPNLIGSEDLNKAVENYLLIEGRTRYALNQIAQSAKDVDKVIFIQGFLHAPGIEAWCRRNQIDLRTKLAPSLIF